MADAVSALECRNRAPESWRSVGILFQEPRLEMSGCCSLPRRIRCASTRGFADFRRRLLLRSTAFGEESRCPVVIAAVQG
jgi:hypothetical protein